MQEHKCPQKRSADIFIIYGPSLDEPWRSWTGWILRVRTIANEQAVYDNEAKHVGELMCQHQFRIAFCPFCGQDLATEPITDPSV